MTFNSNFKNFHFFEITNTKILQFTSEKTYFHIVKKTITGFLLRFCMGFRTHSDRLHFADAFTELYYGELENLLLWTHWADWWWSGVYPGFYTSRQYPLSPTYPWGTTVISPRMLVLLFGDSSRIVWLLLFVIQFWKAVNVSQIIVNCLKLVER